MDIITKVKVSVSSRHQQAYVVYVLKNVCSSTSVQTMRFSSVLYYFCALVHNLYIVFICVYVCRMIEVRCTVVTNWRMTSTKTS